MAIRLSLRRRVRCLICKRLRRVYDFDMISQRKTCIECGWVIGETKRRYKYLQRKLRRSNV